jgi:hypothetical protein
LDVEGWVVEGRVAESRVEGGCMSEVRGWKRALKVASELSANAAPRQQAANGSASCESRCSTSLHFLASHCGAVKQPLPALISPTPRP